MSRLPARLTPFFFDSSQPPVPPDQTPPAPPINNRGDWTEPHPEGWARKTVAVNFIGTVVHERPDPFATEEQKQKRQHKLDKIAARNERVLNEALFILSQSPTGRDVLERFDRDVLGKLCQFLQVKPGDLLVEVEQGDLFGLPTAQDGEVS